MQQYSPALPHTEITEVFPDIFFVMGMNKTHYNDIDLQHSRNMVIVRDNNKLSLINTVRMDDKGLAALDALGKVENVIRIGSFHGRDDAFYLDHYQAKLWAIKGMEHANHKIADVELTNDGLMPFSDCSFFLFETATFPEGIIHINKNGGVLITCDSVKNWIAPDPFFSDETATLYQRQGFFGSATISKIWQQATDVKISDIQRLKTLSFSHLISAHGQPLLNDAHERLMKTIAMEFNI